jgi:hypothetical protein
MPESGIVIRAGFLNGLSAKRLDLSCQHGSASFYLLPGRDAAANEVAIELLRVRHAIKQQCACWSPEHRAPVSATSSPAAGQAVRSDAGTE